MQKFDELSNFDSIKRFEKSVQTVDTLLITIRELTAKNETLEETLKTVSGALDALTARLDKIEKN